MEGWRGELGEVKNLVKEGNCRCASKRIEDCEEEMRGKEYGKKKRVFWGEWKVDGKK